MGFRLNFLPMAAVYQNTCFSDCWGSVGDVTCYHRNGRCYVRRRSSLVFPGTDAQLASLAAHRRALAAWRQLAQGVQEVWNSLARDVSPHRPPFGTGAHISGQNLFVSAYHGFITLGNEHVPEPVPFRSFPPFGLEFLEAEAVDDKDLVLYFDLNMFRERHPERYAVLAKVQLAKAGGGCNPGLMRNVLEDPDYIMEDPERTVAFRILDYRKFSGIDAQEYTLHARVFLLDRERGYRNVPIRIDHDISL